MTNHDSRDSKKSFQDALNSHMEYASQTVASWPEWKQNILAHTRPNEQQVPVQRKSEIE